MTSDTALSMYDLLFYRGVAIVLIGMLATPFVRKVRYARRLYWSSWTIAGGLMASLAYLAAFWAAGGSLRLSYRADETD